MVRGSRTEALLAQGAIDDAAALVAEWDAQAAHSAARSSGRRPPAVGVSSRHTREIGEARAELERAIGEHEAVADPFGRARALLALGIVNRRARRARSTRCGSDEATALFEKCGADGWLQRTRSELGRIGGRTREDGLTAAEHRVANLVAEGRTNREVAADSTSASGPSRHTSTRLREARRSLAHRARARVQATELRTANLRDLRDFNGTAPA